MPDPKKQEYYQQNREARLQYQRDYYRRTKLKRERKKELALLLEPEKWREREERRKAYYREYYQRNRDRICRQRAEKRKQRAAERARGTGTTSQ